MPTDDRETRERNTLDLAGLYLDTHDVKGALNELAEHVIAEGQDDYRRLSGFIADAYERDEIPGHEHDDLQGALLRVTHFPFTR